MLFRARMVDLKVILTSASRFSWYSNDGHGGAADGKHTHVSALDVRLSEPFSSSLPDRMCPLFRAQVSSHHVPSEIGCSTAADGLETGSPIKISSRKGLISCPREAADGNAWCRCFCRVVAERGLRAAQSSRSFLFPAA